MRWPWNSDGLEKKEAEVEKLEEKLTKLEEEKKSWKKRFESEKERRKDLSRKKQEAEEKLNRLNDKLRTSESEEQESDGKKNQEKDVFEPVSFGKVRNILEKLDSMESRDGDFVTVYSPEKVEDLEDLRGLKNSVSADQYTELQDLDGFVAFLDQDIGNTVLKMSPFFRSKFVIEEFFDIAELLEFFNSEKHWTVVAAGETKVFQEEAGEFEEIDSIKSRVDREHSKGGFSQGRFERKRDEQIEGHVKKVKKVLEGLGEDNLYLLGDKKLCRELPGDYLGGFDPNRKKPEQFYQFQLRRF